VRDGVLATLDEHGSLAADSVAAFVGAGTDAVLASLCSLRDQGLVAAVALTKFEGNAGVAVAYWRLTEAGRAAIP
jgi:predicted ArsR family transcriptional regulator